MGQPRSIPGPKPHPVFGTLGRLARFALDPLLYTERLFQTYGPIAALVEGRSTRIVSTEPHAPGTFFFYGPELNRPFLTEHETFHKCALAGPLYPTDPEKPRTRPLTRLLTGLFHVNSAEHRRHRRLLMPAFHKSRIESYRDDMVAITRSAMQNLKPGTVADIRPVLTDLTLRVATKTLLGEDVAERGYEIAREWQRWLQLFRNAAALPFDAPGTPYRAFLDVSHSIDGKAATLIRERRSSPARGSDILSMLLDSTDEHGERLSDDELVGHASVIFAAGHETSSNALCWTLFLLSEHPAVLADLVDELDAVLHGAPPRLEDLARLSLLESVVKESLRILPPVPFNHRICAETTELGGYRVPRGAEVISSIYRTQRLPDLYPEGDRFRPERWASLDPGPYSYNPFGAGPRMCIGATFAMMEIRIVLAMLLQAFRFELVPNARIDRFVSITMSPRQGLPMQIHAQDRRFPVGHTSRVRGNVRQMVMLA
jgi:cytochrome P450